MAQLLSNLPVGAKVKFGKYSINGETSQDITWLIVARNHSGYPSNSITLLTEKIIDLRCFDASEPNHGVAAVRSYGNNRYSISNIDQWLNSSNDAGLWYVKAHTYDQSPNSSEYVANRNTQYASRPGFLNACSNDERNLILSTTIRSITQANLSSDYEDILRKVFLPSCTEIGATHNLGYPEGTVWEYFSSRDNTGRIAYPTQQVIDNTQSTEKPNGISTGWYWGTRTKSSATPNFAYGITKEGESTAMVVCSGSVGIRPALNLSSVAKVSDTTDSEGCYKLVFNSAPPAPTTINTSTTIYGGKSNAISWSSATDPDGDTVTYTLECSLNGGTYTQIYSGTSTVYAHLVPFGTTSVVYRVKATDPSGESSAYTTSSTITVINNNAPVISGADANLGVKSSGFTGTYTVTDANNNTVTVTEAIDGVQIRSLVATLGATITYGITENTWLALPNGSHTLTIRATDGIDTSVRTYIFTKLVETLTIQNSTPWATSTMPTRIMLVITRNIPSAATFKVEVCNNGYDSSPTWEDATDAVTSGLVHVFNNTTKTAANWGVLVRVTVARNGATGACYVSAIGGNFE